MSASIYNELHVINTGEENCAYLVLISALGDNFGSDLDLGFKESFQQISSIDTQQEGNPFSLCKYISLLYYTDIWMILKTTTYFRQRFTGMRS